MDPLIKHKKPRSLFRTTKPPKKKYPPEWRLQAAVVSEFHKWQDGGWDFEFAGDFNAGKRNGSRALLCGLKAGEADIRVYLPRGKLAMIELKAHGGKLHKDQKTRHASLRALGFVVEVVKADTSEDAVEQCRTLLEGWLIEGVMRQ